MKEETKAMTKTLDGADHASEGPRSHRQPEGEVGEHVDDPIYHERQKALEPLRHRHAVVRVLQVDGAPPKTQGETRSDRPYRLHLEPWYKKELVESMEVDDEAEGATLLLHQKNAGKEERLREKNRKILPRERRPETRIRMSGRIATQPIRGIDNKGGLG